MRRWVVATLLAAGLAWYYWLGLTSVAGVVNDDVVYLALAKALATGAGYRELFVPGAPWHVQYPPGYPAMLALIWLAAPMFPANLLAFKALNIGFALLTTALTARFAAEVSGLSRWQAGLAAAGQAIGAVVIIANDMTMSEPMFAAVLLLALLGLEPRVTHAGAWTLRHGLTLAALAVAPMAVRGIAFCLPLAVVAWLVLARRYRAAATVAAGCVALLAPWALWGRVANPGGGYVSWALQHSNGLDPWRALQAMAGQLPAIVFDAVPHAVAPPLGPLATACVGLGFVLSARSRLRVWHLFVALYLGLVAVYPSYGHTPRFVFALSPLLLVAFVRGASGPLDLVRTLGSDRWPARWALAGLSVVLLATSLSGARRVVSLMRREAHHDALLPEETRRVAADQRAVAAWLSARTPPHALVMSDRVALWYLWTGRVGRGYLDGPEPSAETRALWRARPTYAIHPPVASWLFEAFMRAHPDRVAPVYRAPAGTITVYRVSSDW
jgi:hypothetical protein